MKAKVLSGAIGSDWIETESKSGTFKLLVDGRYVAALSRAGDTLIVVSLTHTVELQEDA